MSLVVWWVGRFVFGREEWRAEARPTDGFGVWGCDSLGRPAPDPATWLDFGTKQENVPPREGFGTVAVKDWVVRQDGPRQTSPMGGRFDGVVLGERKVERALPRSGAGN